jgi:hypothetical protein
MKRTLIAVIGIALLLIATMLIGYHVPLEKWPDTKSGCRSGVYTRLSLINGESLDEIKQQAAINNQPEQPDYSRGCAPPKEYRLYLL